MSGSTQRKPVHRVPRLERTAYHEAGHAVMAVLQGRTFGDISIIPSEGTSGRVDGFALTQDQQIEIAAGPRRRLERHVRSEIMIYYAGHVAESMRTGKLTLLGAENDLAQAAEMATKLYADEATRGAFVLWLWHLTREALQERVNWAAVGTLALALLVEEVVPGRRARMIVGMVQRVAGEEIVDQTLAAASCTT
ncbi:MAG: M50 family metallopeptidase [Deltaproteobacteria bacterium]|nr:M50 family metallopeptidase [Deltaproteobacteria bacterium]